MKKSIIALCGILVLASCAGQLDITPPNDITDEQIQEILSGDDDEKIDMVISAISNPMIKWFNNSDITGGYGTINSSDAAYYTQQGLDYMRSLEANDIVLGYSQSTSVGGLAYQCEDFWSGDLIHNQAYWNCAVEGITAANQELYYFSAEDATTKTLQEARARGLLVRAYNYMCLMEIYQDAYTNGGSSKLGMPIYDTYDPAGNAENTVARSTSAETYDFIISDIEEAITLLNSAQTGYSQNDGNTSTFNLGMAQFLLARAALWYGDYSTCITACNALINSGTYSFIPEENYGGTNTGVWSPTDSIEVLPTTNAFICLDVNPEYILGYRYGGSYASSNFNAWVNIFGSSYGGSSEEYARIDDRLYELIDDNDYRQDCWYTSEIGTYYYTSNNGYGEIPSYCNLKFAATHGLTSTGELSDKSYAGNADYVKWRLSEVYLMLAEAYAQNGNDSSAKSTLNTLLAARTREGETALTCDTYSSMSGLSTLEMVQLQSRIELWAEGGREFYNNKRWDIPVSRSDSGNHVEKTSTLTVAHMTCEIPTEEVLYGGYEQN